MQKSLECGSCLVYRGAGVAMPGIGPWATPSSHESTDGHCPVRALEKLVQGGILEPVSGGHGLRGGHGGGALEPALLWPACACPGIPRWNPEVGAWTVQPPAPGRCHHHRPPAWTAPFRLLREHWQLSRLRTQSFQTPSPFRSDGVPSLP